MATGPITQACIWEVETGGNDPNNSGGFDPGQTAGMATDGAATSANTSSPVFSSASYNFVSGDVGAWLFVASGTNWLAGWYKIASVASNQATLSAAIGAGVLYASTFPSCNPTTALGCATTASPTSATWTVDYSQQSSPRYTYTDLAIASNHALISSSAFPFGYNTVGNIVNVTAGSGFTVQRNTIIAFTSSGATATSLNSNGWGTASSTSGSGYLGGALATPGQVAAVITAVAEANKVYIQSGTYTLTTSTAGAAGPLSLTQAGATNAPNWWEGYGTVRGDLGTKPVISSGSVSTITIFAITSTAAGGVCRNITFNGNSGTAITGMTVAVGRWTIERCLFENCTVYAFNNTSQTNVIRCAATGCSGTGVFASSGGQFDCCEAYANTTSGFILNSSGSCINCIASANTGSTTDGFQYNISFGSAGEFRNCIAYGNGRHGYNGTQATLEWIAVGCLAEANGVSGTGYGFTNTGGVQSNDYFAYCGAYNNATGAINLTNIIRTAENFVNNTTGSFFVNAASGNFALNNTTNQGMLAHGTGFPGLMPRGTTTAYTDIGLQHKDYGGGNGFFFF